MDIDFNDIDYEESNNELPKKITPYLFYELNVIYYNGVIVKSRKYKYGEVPKCDLPIDLILDNSFTKIVDYDEEKKILWLEKRD